MCLLLRVLALLLEWDVLDEFDRGGISQRMLVNPNVWTDGSLVVDKVVGASSAGFGVYAHVSGHAWRHRKWEAPRCGAAGI